MIDKQIKRNNNSIVFFVNNDCELNCEYCFETERIGNLSFEYAKNFIDIVLNDDDFLELQGTKLEYLNDAITLTFFGGDPLNNPELCDEIISYFREKVKGHRWENNHLIYIPTSGIYFTDERVQKFLMKYDNQLIFQISIDGCPELHNLTRDNSMDRILAGWDWFKNYYTKNGRCISIKSTYNEKSIPYLFESVKFLHEKLEIKYINTAFNFQEINMDENKCIEFNNQLEQITDYLLSQDILYYGLYDLSMFNKKCLPGKILTLVPSGKIYPCYKFIPFNSTNEIVFGDIWNGINKSECIKIRECVKNAEMDIECQSCPIKMRCTFNCPGHAYLYHNKFWHAPSGRCTITQIIDYNARKYWNEYWKRNSVKSFLPEVDYSGCKEKIWENQKVQV